MLEKQTVSGVLSCF